MPFELNQPKITIQLMSISPMNISNLSNCLASVLQPHRNSCKILLHMSFSSTSKIESQIAEFRMVPVLRVVELQYINHVAELVTTELMRLQMWVTSFYSF